MGGGIKEAKRMTSCFVSEMRFLCFCVAGVSFLLGNQSLSAWFLLPTLIMRQPVASHLSLTTVVLKIYCPRYGIQVSFQMATDPAASNWK
jgi:hypothetical protein